MEDHKIWGIRAFVYRHFAETTRPPSVDETASYFALTHEETGAVYEELHRLARRYMRNESPGHTLQTSALVHEAFIRLVDQRDVHWQNRSHFFGIAAQMMRRILVDYARSRNFAKRGGGAVKLSLEEGLIVSEERSEQVVAVHEALEGLAKIDPRQAQIVELKFFGGLSNEEAAAVLTVSPGTVARDWTMAKAWLRREISKSASDR